MTWTWTWTLATRQRARDNKIFHFPGTPAQPLSSFIRGNSCSFFYHSSTGRPNFYDNTIEALCSRSIAPQARGVCHGSSSDDSTQSIASHNRTRYCLGCHGCLIYELITITIWRPALVS